MKFPVIPAVAVLAVLSGADAFAPAFAGLMQRQGGAHAAMTASRRPIRACRPFALKMSETDPVAKTPEPEPEPEKENMMTKVKAAGVAGLISYALWEFAFWTISVPIAIFSYHATTGQWPSFDDKESTAKVSAVIFGFLNLARALVPVRIALTLGTAPLVDKYLIKPFNLDKKETPAE